MTRTILIERLRKKAVERRSVGDKSTAKLLDDAAGAIEPQIIDDADATRWRKLMDLAAYAGEFYDKKALEVRHAWRFRPVVTTHKNLNDAIDSL